MRTRKARIAGARPQITRTSPAQVGQPFKVSNITTTKIGEVIEDYMLAEGAQGVKISGEVTLQPLYKESPQQNEALSLDTSWHLKLQQAADLSKEVDGEADDKRDLLMQAIAKYDYLGKRNLVKMRG